MPATATISFADGLKVVVPDSLETITTYVLLEQGDWFEDEIRFLRRVVQPASHVVDIGANYGVYTLSLARQAGGGRLWSFEPTSETAAMLERSVQANGYTHVSVVKEAVSDQVGSAQLSLSSSAECNALAQPGDASGAQETVSVTTLDACMDRFGWASIDVLKMDAEGAEQAIVRGGQRFFDTLSPLVMYEARTDEVVDTGVLAQLKAFGYQAFRLAPGLGALVPFEPGEPVDPFLLNLFCCKPDRAEALAARSLLVPRGGARGRVEASADLQDSIRPWGDNIGRWPYSRALSPLWRDDAPRDPHRASVDEALALHVASRDESLPLPRRSAALQRSHALIADVCKAAPTLLRLSTLSRVARDLGRREEALEALRSLAEDIIARKEVVLTEPFLAPVESLEPVALPEGGSWGDWVWAGVLQGIEELSAFSSYYTGTEALQRLQVLQHIGLGSAEMQRRLKLVRRRFALPDA